MKNSKQIMSDVIITFGNREVTVDGVEFWEKFYNEHEEFMAEVDATRLEGIPSFMTDKTDDFRDAKAVFSIIFNDFERTMLADAKDFIEGKLHMGSLHIDDISISANSLYLTAIGKLVDGMVQMIKDGIAETTNARGLAAILTITVSTVMYFIHKEDNK